MTRLGIEPRPSGHIPDALTTELSSLVGLNHTMNSMYLPPPVMVTSHPQRTTQVHNDHQGQLNDDSATTTWGRLNSSDRLHNPNSTPSSPPSYPSFCPPPFLIPSSNIGNSNIMFVYFFNIIFVYYLKYVWILTCVIFIRKCENISIKSNRLEVTWPLKQGIWWYGV